MNTLTPFGRLADHICLAGVKEIVSTDFCLVRCVWIVFLFLGTFSTGFYLHGIVGDYYERPTETKIELNISHSYNYPPIVVCPNVWLDSDQLIANNISKAVTLFALTPFAMFANPNRLPVPTESEYKSATAKLNISNVIAFYYFVARHSSTFLSFFHTDDPSHPLNGAKKAFVTESVCYALDLQPKRCYSDALLEVVVKFSAVDRYNAIVYKGHHVLMINPSLATMRWHEHIQLDRQTLTYVRIVPKKFVFLNLPTNDKACVEDIGYSQKTCHFRCVEDKYFFVKHRCKRPMYFVNNLSRSVGPNDLCSLSLRPNKSLDSDSFIAVSALCTKQCLPACTQMVFDVFVTNTGIQQADISEDEARFRINYDVCNIGVRVFQEVRKYSLDSFFSNVGGMLELWLSASTVTVIQLFAYLMEEIWIRVIRTETMTIKAG